MASGLLISLANSFYYVVSNIIMTGTFRLIKFSDYFDDLIIYYWR